MEIVPLTLKEANAFVANLHRHHKPCTGHRFSLGLRNNEGDLVGVAIVGRPVARAVDQYNVCEVSRLCTDGTRNACSALYGACARVAKEMGFKYIQTYILESEPGTSLRASGWQSDGVVRKDGVGWNNRKGRTDSQPTEAKERWKKVFKIDV